jgi:hypothetical protein
MIKRADAIEVVRCNRASLSALHRAWIVDGFQPPEDLAKRDFYSSALKL